MTAFKDELKFALSERQYWGDLAERGRTLAGNVPQEESGADRNAAITKRDVEKLEALARKYPEDANLADATPGQIESAIEKYQRTGPIETLIEMDYNDWYTEAGGMAEHGATLPAMAAKLARQLKKVDIHGLEAAKVELGELIERSKDERTEDSRRTIQISNQKIRVIDAAIAMLKKGDKYASKISPPAEVHGDVQPQPGKGAGKVPPKKGGAGIQPQAPGRVQKDPRRVFRRK